MLGKSEEYDEPRIYALDRIKALEQAERTFKLPKKFDVEKFFADYYGIIIGEADAVAKAMWPTHVFEYKFMRIRQHKVVVFPLCPEMAGKNFTFTQNSILYDER